MYDEMPHIVLLLGQLSGLIRRPFWAFSTHVAPAATEGGVPTAQTKGGTSTASQTVTIITPPLAGFTANPTSGCGPLTVQFSNASSPNATSFEWSFPGGTPNNSTEDNLSLIHI